MAKFFLRKKIGDRVVNGHPWIFANELGDSEGSPTPGDIVEVYSYNGSFVGKGFINPSSQIRIRLLTRDKDEIADRTFFDKKIKNAWAYRQQLGYTENCRLVFGEADGLPALIIDKFNDCFVVQTLALGIELWKDTIVSILQDIFSPKGIYERNDVSVRQLEGLEQIKGFLTEAFDTNIIINENGLKFHADIAEGQKTGYFLDQHDNRRMLQHIVKDADVLDAFCYTGSFSVHAAHYGAKNVLGLDHSADAVAMAAKNAELNGYNDKCRFETLNAFDVLKTWSKEGKKYDVVISDPPTLTNSRSNIHKAITGYKEINLRSMNLLKPGGFLVTCSTSNLIAPDVFLKTIEAAAKDAKRQLRQLTFQTQSPDHPIMLHIPTTQHLKFLVVQVL